MTNNQILTLANGLGAISPPDMLGDFNYAITANLLEAQRIAIPIQEAIKDSKEVAEFKRQLQEIQEKNAARDANGKPIKEDTELPNGTVLTQYNIPDSKDPNSKFCKEVDALTAKYQKDIDKQNERLKILGKENKEFKPVLIERKDIPKGLSRDQMNLIFPLIHKG